jgi:hypothetical protein
MICHLKQKSPPVGGRAVDDRLASRSVAPSRRKGRTAPPEVSGRGRGNGVQVRHSTRYLFTMMVPVNALAVDGADAQMAMRRCERV